MWRTLLDHLGRIRPAWVLIGVMMLAATLRLWRLDVLPPGLFFDEAYNGFDAREVLRSAHWPLFFPANNGREPLFIYLQTLSVAVLGATPFALRIVAVAVGIATIPIVYFCAKTLLIARPATPQQERAAGWLALVAATGLAVSYWHLSLSRLGFRVNLLIPISALAIAFFWRAWRGGRLRDYVWSGFWLALAMYTYIAARLLPLVLLAFVVIQLLLSLWRYRRERGQMWTQWRPRLVGLLVLAGVAILVVLPLAWTLLANPAWLSARSAQVSIWAEWQSGDLRQWLGGLAANALVALRAFYDQGDQNLRHNLPGRPANDLLLASLFTLGWLSALVTLVSRPRSMLVLLWFVIMLLPTVLSTEAPHYLRSAGALPPLAILYALGAEAVIKLGRRVRNRSAQTDPGARSDHAAVLAVLLLLLLWSGTTTARDYFQRWARLPGLGTAFDVSKQLAAETAAQLLMDPASYDALLMASELYLQPQMGFALGPVAAGVAPSVLQQQTANIRMVQEDGFDPRASLMLVSRDGAQPISTWLQPLGSEQLAATSPARTQRAQAHQPGWPQITEVNLPPETPLHVRQIRYPLDVTFANGLRLVGYDVEPDVLQPGQGSARLTLFWQDDASGRLRPNAQEGEWRSDFDVFVNLNVAGAVAATANGQLRGQALAERLHAGQPVVEDVRVLAVPETPSTGKAHFEVGLYRYRPGNDPGFNERIAIIDQAGQAVADQVDLGALWIGASPEPAGVPDPGALEVQFDDGIQLMGVALAEDPGNPQRLWVELAWQALDRASTGYTAFVHLLDSAGQIVAQFDAPPGGAGNPTNLWAPGESVRSTFPLDLTTEQKRAGVRLRVGLYEPASGRQLPIAAAGDPAVDISGGSYVLIDIQ